MGFRLVFIGFAAFLAFALPAAAEPRLNVTIPNSDSGLRGTLLDASLVATALREDTTDPQELLAAAQADYPGLLGVLYNTGRYGAAITIRVDGREASAIPPLSPPSKINVIDIVIRPGPVYRFKAAEIGPLPPQSTVIEGFQRGNPAQLSTIKGAAEAAIQNWRAAGYAKARLANQNITANHANNTLSARVIIDPGPRLTFGEVSISGNQNVRTRRIRTIAGLEPGPVFDPQEIDRATTRLRRTGSFSAVAISEADTPVGSTLPLDIGVTEAVPRRFGFGAEYSTVEGVRLSGFWLHRNFLGGAERFRVDSAIAGIGGQTGGVDYSLGVRYERPATPRADVDLFAELQLEKLEEPDFTSRNAEFTLGFTRYATDDLTVEFGLGYLFSETTDDFGTETYRMVTLPLSAELDRRDNKLNPRKGYFVDLEVTPFLGLSGTTDGARAKLDARAYRSTEKLTFAGRMQLGALSGPSLLESPPFYRFFSGGGGTVRGQSYQSLDIEIGGNRTGGRSFLGLSGEIRGNVTDDIQLVGFVDWGYVGAESFPDFTGGEHAGAGFGIRYNTGIGPIRFDIATPVSGEADASDIYLYVGIGQAF